MLLHTRAEPARSVGIALEISGSNGIAAAADDDGTAANGDGAAADDDGAAAGSKRGHPLQGP